MVDEPENARKAEGHKRDALKSIHLQLAQYSKKKIPPQMRGEEEASTSLAYAQHILDTQILGFSHRLLKMEAGEGTEATSRLTLAMFLLERTAQLRDASLEKDSLGLYALYVSIRTDVCNMLGSSYYGKTLSAIMAEYLDIEPRIIVASQLCGFMPPPEPANIPALYQKKLTELVGKA